MTHMETFVFPSFPPTHALLTDASLETSDAVFSAVTNAVRGDIGAMADHAVVSPRMISLLGPKAFIPFHAERDSGARAFLSPFVYLMVLREWGSG